MTIKEFIEFLKKNGIEEKDYDNIELGVLADSDFSNAYGEGKANAIEIERDECGNIEVWVESILY